MRWTASAAEGEMLEDEVCVPSAMTEVREESIERLRRLRSARSSAADIRSSSTSRCIPKAALTIDTNAYPPHVLLVRGTASIEVIDGVPPEYLEGAKKMIEPQIWQVFEAQVRRIFKQMARITIVPEWAKLFDFENRIPDFLRRLMKGPEDR